MKRLFRDDESYNRLGNVIHVRAQIFAQKLLEDYPDVSTRDLENVVNEGMSLEFLGARLDK